MITTKVADFIYESHDRRIMEWNDDISNTDCLERYAAVMHTKGSALNNRFGFVDGTDKQISQPNVNQRQVYKYQKIVHALNLSQLPFQMA